MEAFISSKLVVKKSAISGKGVFTKEPIVEGDIIIDAELEIVEKTDKFTIQINNRERLRGNLINNYLNHSCQPNIRVQLFPRNKPRITFIALRNIKTGEEICRDYNTTEWDLDEKFMCNCRKTGCLKEICGARYLTKKQQEKIFEITSPFIFAKFQS
jgi:SET domain-containing protein